MKGSDGALWFRNRFLSLQRLAFRTICGLGNSIWNVKYWRLTLYIFAFLLLKIMIVCETRMALAIEGNCPYKGNTKKERRTDIFFKKVTPLYHIHHSSAGDYRASLNIWINYSLIPIITTSEPALEEITQRWENILLGEEWMWFLQGKHRIPHKSVEHHRAQKPFWEMFKWRQWQRVRDSAYNHDLMWGHWEGCGLSVAVPLGKVIFSINH